MKGMQPNTRRNPDTEQRTLNSREVYFKDDLLGKARRETKHDKI
jgi:hypothetical protein